MPLIEINTKMGKTQINTKSRDYLNDKETFLKELKQFNESKNIPYRVPVVNGVEIDLYLLYSSVQQKGGLSRVNQTDTWESFLRLLKLPYPCVNGSTLLRRIYGMYLEKYERAKGPPGRDDDNDMDEDPRRSRSGMPRISFGSGTYISASGEQLKTTAPKFAGPSERLTLSLLSPMPNEQDFAINVCTVLAADHSNRLPLNTTPHILDFLLAHAGVYNHSSLRDTIGRSYYEARGRYPHDFWEMRAGGGGAKELADETKFMQPGIEQPELMVQALAAHNTLTDCLMNGGDNDDILDKVVEDLHQQEMEDWVTEPSEEDQLFAPELPGGASCVYTQRVLQIASIVRSLSFHEDNVQYLSRNTTLIRFLLLCANCWVGTLRQSGLDTLGNISTELLIKDPATCLISRHVLSTIQTALSSPDRARILAALELLNKLAQNEANEDALLRSLEAKVYSDVCSLLTLRDIMVLVCTLECVYALTSLGEAASEAVARVTGLVHTLVSLVTVEAQSYGPRACILMRVVETVSGPAAVAERESEKPQQQQPQVQVKPQEPVTTSSPHAHIIVSNSAPPNVTPTTALSSIQVSHLHQRTVQENEHFAQAWLRSTYEPLPANDNSTCDAAEMYRNYMTCCTKVGRKGIIAPAHFPRLVRTVFGGTVGPNTVATSSGEMQQLYVGIRAKNTTVKATTPAGPSSPILKAQLTNKTDVKPVVTQAQTQPASHPHLSQALESTANTSTSLIKHLLAHKVAQRQNQRAPPAGAVVIQTNTNTGMEVDPETLIKCTTITPGGVASNTPLQDKVNVAEDIGAPKEAPVQIQIDEQAQLTITAQNKMLADLLEKKSNPPVQVVQMNQHAPTIQITETGQIVQVKPEASPVIVNPDQSAPYLQIKNEQGQLIQIKNDSGQVIQLKSDQGVIQFKNDPGQLVQIKNESVIHSVKTEVDPIVTDHSYTEPPSKRPKVEDKTENNSPQESVSKTAANLYAALAASALEDEEDLLPQKPENSDAIQQPVLVSGAGESPVIIQEPILQVQQPTLQVQQPSMQVQQSSMQVQQTPHQMPQPMLQVQPMDVQNIISSQSGQILLQEKTVTSQPQFVQQSMQLIATPNTPQGSIGYISSNIPGNMMQKTIIIVQGASGGPLTLTNKGVIQSTQRVIVSQSALVSTSQPIAVVKSTIAQNSPQITQSQQPIITTQPQPHKAQIVNQQPQQIVVTQKQPPALISTTTGNPIGNQQIIQGNQQIIQGNQQIIQGNQQLLQGNQQIIAVSNNQQIIVNTPMKQNVHRVVQPQRIQTTVSNAAPVQIESKSVVQSPAKTQQPVMRQVITRQPVMVGNTKIGDKETVVSQPVTEQKPPKSDPTPPPQPSTSQNQEDTPWICHWKGCGKTFTNASSVFTHAARTHCPGGAGGEAPCMWIDCDRVPRKTFALLNHLNDKHCTQQALKAIYNSRRHAAAEPEANKPVSVAYPPNAALAALNKHATDLFNPRELMDENEGPVTKSIRLTAALILRNIVIYSNTGRRMLRQYEAHLASIALSSVEASRTIAQVLYDMNNI